MSDEDEFGEASELEEGGTRKNGLTPYRDIYFQGDRSDVFSAFERG